MKRIFTIHYSLFAFLVVMFFASCQPEHYRTVYPAGEPQLTGEMLTSHVLYGADSIAFKVQLTEKTTPLSQLQVKVMVGLQVVASDMIRTKDYDYSAILKYAVPFGPNMPDGQEVKVYLTATNVEGTEANLILSGCTGSRPAIETLYVMPPTISYTKIGKGAQMTWDDATQRFVLYGLGWPKSIECLLAVTGTKFGRIDWTKPVFGLVGSTVQLISEQLFDEGTATSIPLANDLYETLDTIIFDPLTFDITIGGKVAEPVTALDVINDLEEQPSYIVTSSVAKKYRGAKLLIEKDAEITITGTTDLAKAYNLDWFEYLDNGKVRFLGESGMYYISYNPTTDYIVVEPLYDVEKPDVMYLCGKGMGQPSWTPSATSGWGFDSPDQNFVSRQVAPQVYQFTVYMLNGDNEDFDDYGSLNFKFFHQHGWGGEENGGEYTQSGLPIIGVGPEGLTKKDGSTGNETGNWIATTDAIEGIYRITLDMNKKITSYEKVR